MRPTDEEIRRQYFVEFLPARVIAQRLGLSRQRIHQIVFPEKDEARRAVQAALRAGVLVRPSTCSSCGQQARIEAHHADYARPLDVEWLCPSCHKRHWKKCAPVPPPVVPEPRPCVLCGTTMPRARRAKTCSRECAVQRKALYEATDGYKLRRLRRARHIAANPDRWKPAQVAWAKRLLAGAANEPKRRYAIRGSLLAKALLKSAIAKLPKAQPVVEKP